MHDLNVFDIFTRMCLLQESSDEHGVLSHFSTSAVGLVRVLFGYFIVVNS